MDGGGGGVISGQPARMPAIITGCARSTHVCPSAPRLAPRKNMRADRLQNWPPPADEYFSSIGAGGCGWGQRALERASAIILAPKRGKYLGWRDNGKGAPPAISVAEP